mmetsp:Transcript_62721/g.112575  ORF Transcript_62721/g.112575 Transcript_62721/m.112575 type:complete len:329 (-) Transcript_62721:10-996(-)
MLHCSCGFSCGVKAALERHLAKFAGTESETEHRPDDGESLPVPALPSRIFRSVPVLGRNSAAHDLNSDEQGEASPVSPLETGSPFCHMCRTLPLPSADDWKVRLLLVRHAQSANKARQPGQAAEADPGLTDLGFCQAEALAERLSKDLRLVKPPYLTIVSSPMRRCLYTIQPTIRLVKPQHVLCHGGGFEFGCAGKGHPGSSQADICENFKEFLPVGFNSDGFWDYQGHGDKENEEECRARGIRLAEWLLATAQARSGPQGHTLVLVTHQTINDLLCSILLDRSPFAWKYGHVRYRLQNAGITEVFVTASGEGTFGVRNDGAHLLTLR